jgi:transposase
MSGGPEDNAKAEALRRQRVLNPKPETVTDERFRTDEFFDPRDLVQVKYEMVRRVREERVTVTEATERFGFSRPTFYEARRALEAEGLAGLVPKPPGPKGAHKLTEEVMEFVEGLLEGSPGLASEELARRIAERFGRSVHPRSIERALERWEKKRRRTG